jgi:hypothetical protein
MNSTVINSTKRLSGLQSDVLILYRALLRAAFKKDSNNTSGLYSFGIVFTILTFLLCNSIHSLIFTFLSYLIYL